MTAPPHADRRASCARDIELRARSTPSSSRSPTCRVACRASGSTASSSSTRSSGHGTEGCNYLLAVDVDMNTVDGYAISSWERGYGDMMFDLDLADPAPHPRPAVLGDGPVRPVVARRQRAGARRRRGRCCKAQVDAAAELGFVALAGTELEFIVFEETYEQAWDRGYHGPDRRQPLQRRLLDPRRHEGRAAAARHPQRDVCRGRHRRERQGRVQPRPARDRVPLRRGRCRPCDNHVVYKTAAKEIAAQHGQSLTFMAKFDEREGNSCHIHLSLRGHRRRDRLRRRRARGRPQPAVRALRRRGPGDDARVHPALRAEHQLLQAVPARARSRRPRSPGGTDNRTCALRVVGHGAGLRVENRVPGGDVNPYLAVAGDARRRPARHREELPLEPAFAGNAYASDKAAGSLAAAARPATCSPAPRWPARRSATTSSSTTRTRPQVELAAFNAAVTDWERIRGFERL